MPGGAAPGQEGIVVQVDRQDGVSEPFEFTVKLRLDTLVEIQFFKHGGVMPYVMRGLVAKAEAEAEAKAKAEAAH